MGYFKIDRCIADHWLWEEKPFDRARAWIDMILLAEWKDGRQVFCGKEIVTLSRGQLCETLRFLGERWGWSKDKVSRFLTVLESQKMVSISKTGSRQVVTIENYTKYQDVPREERDKDETDMRQSRDKSEKASYLYKKERREEGKNIGGKTAFSPPSLEEVKTYCNDKCLLMDAEAFYDYFESVGWVIGKGKPMKDWKAACRNWAKRDRERLSERDSKARNRTGITIEEIMSL